jgi:leader peptidase (prepilin peptidase)/N-methyltransferase
MFLEFAKWSPKLLAGAFFLVGLVAGSIANLWATGLTTSTEQTASHEKVADARIGIRVTSLGIRGLFVAICTGLLIAAYVLAAVRLQCQHVPEVQPDDSSRTARIFFHLVLITFLVAATLTDLRKYVIPDQITLAGLFVGLIAATVSGQLQMEHFWVDWNQEIPGIRGPYIPDWLDSHRHWHGFTWSIAGALVGAGLTLFVRGMSGLILGREALGSGDITLMAMIGSFLGWQPTVVVFFLAPMCGIICTVPLRLVTNKAYLPYGPFLAAGTIVVLFYWKWMWQWTRLVFGHPQSLALLGGSAAAGLVVLLFILRIWQARFGEPHSQEIRFEE